MERIVDEKVAVPTSLEDKVLLAQLSGCAPHTLYRDLTPEGDPRADAPTLLDEWDS